MSLKLLYKSYIPFQHTQKTTHTQKHISDISFHFFFYKSTSSVVDDKLLVSFTILLLIFFATVGDKVG
jgi:hypothetical protein